MPAAPPQPVILLAFDPSNRLAARVRGSGALTLPFTGGDLAEATHALATAFPVHTPPSEHFIIAAGGREWRVFFTQVRPALPGPSPTPAAPATHADGIAFFSIEKVEEAARDALLAAVVAQLGPHLIEIPYLHLGENDFIYKFRPAQERNTAIYAQDAASSALYQSRLCAAIKALARQHERSAAAPVTLDFGAVRYVIPSHFGFCLGVKNAIERAYETLAERSQSQSQAADSPCP